MEINEDHGEIPQDHFNSVLEKIKYNLPESYKNLIKYHDGLEPKANTFDFTDLYGYQGQRDIYFLSFFKHDSSEDILEYQSNIDETEINGCGVKGLFAFGECAGGDSICFDYRENPNTKEPAIVLVYHDDVYTSKDGVDQLVVSCIADSFDDFLEMLYIFEYE